MCGGLGGRWYSYYNNVFWCAVDWVVGGSYYNNVFWCAVDWVVGGIAIIIMFSGVR